MNYEERLPTPSVGNGNQWSPEIATVRTTECKSLLEHKITFIAMFLLKKLCGNKLHTALYFQEISVICQLFFHQRIYFKLSCFISHNDVAYDEQTCFLKSFCFNLES